MPRPRSDGVILGEAKRSQNELHQSYGGVVPGLARDAHAGAIDAVVSEALGAAGLQPGALDAVGVTMGPGLEICLRVGFHAARNISLDHELPCPPPPPPPPPKKTTTGGGKRRAGEKKTMAPPPPPPPPPRTKQKTRGW